MFIQKICAFNVDEIDGSIQLKRDLKPKEKTTLHSNITRHFGRQSYKINLVLKRI